MFFIILLILILVDQITKYIAFLYLQPENTIPVINNFFYLTYVENTAVSFGISDDKTTGLSILIILIIVIMVAGYYVYKNSELEDKIKYTIAIIMAGVIGNLIDRIRVGYIINFFDFQTWPVFNIADILIVTGTIILAFMLIAKIQKGKVKI